MKEVKMEYCSDCTQEYIFDHLGSAQVVTNHAGQLYERLEYTPYGETWIEWKNPGLRLAEAAMPYRFTGKELDTETGLYYYGARYLDPKTSRWLSADPAMGDYLPGAPVSAEARRRNGSLPGMGGVYNYVNLHVYHYAGNNPVKYTDPDGRTDFYLRINDNGTVSFINNEGNEVGNLGVTTFQSNRQTNNFGDVIIGATFEMRYTDMGSGYSDFNFVQTVRSSEDGGQPRNDLSPEGILYNTSRESEIYRERGYATNGAFFSDSPRRSNLNSPTEWEAETSLVGKNQDGNYEILGTIRWGFKFDPNTQNRPDLTGVTIEDTSEFQLDTINRLNQ
jgi:RHS repeat-associated protein